MPVTTRCTTSTKRSRVDTALMPRAGAATPRKQHHVTVPLAWRAAAVVLTLAGTVLVALAWGSTGEPPMGETLAVALSGIASLALGVRLWLTQRADDVGGLTWSAV